VSEMVKGTRAGLRMEVGMCEAVTEGRGWKASDELGLNV
jgi:hypothetical protein